ncbi:hypothetical protein ACU9SG_002740 [Serratia marcescens]|uniref:hypothetical protein n=1 Tax=Serratia marcescens TaxID=615 RepID=UPI0007450EC3|nr:hypothetical protein [Serratia marcescens]EME1466540.1 hypothetical protein [Serratia marcescens]MDP8622268.1 hypothetical protein [Serratia marcescens]TWY30491.1 hypothetical protein FR965_10665 [Serratia marcescens]CVA06931.1 Uncharacterised protein [Serratia marcescens]CVD61297.1 Uncharacterised protein [Serratia marcescens]
MATMQLIDAQCRVEQAQQILNLWLESCNDRTDQVERTMVCAMITLLDGVPESIRAFSNSTPAAQLPEAK